MADGPISVKSTSDCGRLELTQQPGTGRLLSETNGSFGGVTLPFNAAKGPDGSLYLLDRVGLQLKRFDTCDCDFVIVPCFGGEGNGNRQLETPGGIGIQGGFLYVCDTGNHRVSVFSLRGFVTRGFLVPPASAGLTNLWEPFGIAFDSARRIYVTDGANGGVHRFSRRGVWEAFLAGFGKATYIAIDSDNRIHVAREGFSEVVVTDFNGISSGTVSQPEEIARRFPCAEFITDAFGQLHLGPLCAQSKGESVFDLNGSLVSNPKPPAPLQYLKKGRWISQPLDSELYRCQWHRVILWGKLPQGTSVQVATFAAEVELTSAQIQALPDENWDTKQTAHQLETGGWDTLVRSRGGCFLWLKLELRGNGSVTPSLASIVIEYPRISLRRYLPAVFGMEPVSADFTDRFLSLFDTTLRSIEIEIDQEARLFDPLSAPSEQDAQTGQDFLDWLAGWIGIALDRNWPETKRRAFLKAAPKYFDLRGTREGLWRILLLFMEIDPQSGCCTDFLPKRRCLPLPDNCAPIEEPLCAWEPPPFILEHFRLRRWLFLGTGRLGDDAILWGQNIVNRSQLNSNAQVGQTKLVSTPDPFRDPFHVYAHKFSVFLPARFGKTETQRRSIETLLKVESPAHTLHQVEYVEPRFRIGVQSMIGLDSVIGKPPQGEVRLGETTLGSGSRLTAPPNEQGRPNFEIGEARVGATTSLD